MSEKELLQLIYDDLQQLKKRTEIIEEKLDVSKMMHEMSHKKFDDLTLDIKVSEREIRRDINHLKDAQDTIVTVLQGKGILPKAQ